MTGLDEKDKVVVKLIDTTGEDITLALPLWAGIPEAQQANTLIGRNISTADRFDRPFGLPSLPISPDPEADDVSMRFIPVTSVVEAASKVLEVIA